MENGQFSVHCHNRTAPIRWQAATFLDKAAHFHSQVLLHVSAHPNVRPTQSEILQAQSQITRQHDLKATSSTTLTWLPRHQQRRRQHQQTGVNVRHNNCVQQVALKAFPHAQALVGAHRYHIAGRTRQRHNCTVMCLNVVHTSTGQQLPDAQQAILWPRAACVRLIVIDEQTRERTTVAMQRVQQLARVQLKHLSERKRRKLDWVHFLFSIF